MIFTSKDYLPNSEERIEHLREIVDGRTVAILAAGPSINELENRISELRHADICYFGLNSFIQEKYILQQIDKHLSVYMDSCCDNIPKTIKDIIDFVNREEDNMFVSAFYNDTFGLLNSDFDLNQFLRQYDRKLIFFSLSDERSVPNRSYPLHFPLCNSLMMLIQLAIIGKASRIVLFGADGGCKEAVEEYCYRQSEYHTAPLENYIWDTNVAFNPVLPISIRNIYNTYKIPTIDILNSSKNSFYTPFPIISYDDAFEYLLTGKKFNRKSDLRVPKVSVISPVVNTRDFLRETVESISNQSYSNHEHIIVYSEADDETRDIMRQFPYVRWISEKNIENLQAFKKGISMARGKYIFHCRIADGYLNHDWLNTCVEVLENNPDISLVWGLSQHVSEKGSPRQIANVHLFNNPPSQKKYFIYYWLKKKILFPEANFCVRKSVLKECFPLQGSKASNERETWLAFNYKFNTSGYLPYFVPVIANYYRSQGGIEGQSADSSMQNWTKGYCEDIEQYKRQLIQRKTVHHYKNGAGELLPHTFSRNIFLFFDIGRHIKSIGRYIKSKLPNVCLLVMEKALFFWRTYRWGAFRVGTVAVWNRLAGILYKRITNNGRINAR